MNVLTKMKSVTLALAVAATSFVAMVPDSYAHACNGKGAITIRPGKVHARACQAGEKPGSVKAVYVG